MDHYDPPIFNGTIAGAQHGVVLEEGAPSLKSQARKILFRFNPDKAASADKLAATSRFHEVSKDLAPLSDPTYMRSVNHYLAMGKPSASDIRTFMADFLSSDAVFRAAQEEWQTRDENSRRQAQQLATNLQTASDLEIVDSTGTLEFYIYEQLGSETFHVRYSGRDDRLLVAGYLTEKRLQLCEQQHSYRDSERSKLLTVKALHDTVVQRGNYVVQRELALAKLALAELDHQEAAALSHPEAREAYTKRPAGRYGLWDDDDDDDDDHNDNRPKKRAKTNATVHASMATTSNATAKHATGQKKGCSECDKNRPGVGCKRHKSQQQQWNTTHKVVFGRKFDGTSCENCIKKGYFCSAHEFQRLPNFGSNHFPSGYASNDFGGGINYPTNLFSGGPFFGGGFSTGTTTTINNTNNTNNFGRDNCTINNYNF